MMSRTVDIVVVGAGSIGCNTAWHLQQQGRKVLLVDAMGVATQSTAAAAGFVAEWAGIHMPSWGADERRMERYGIDFYTRLAARTPHDVGFAACGIAYVYATDQEWKIALTNIDRARELGTVVNVLTDHEAAQLLRTPSELQPPKVAFSPDAIRLRAPDAIRALADEFVAAGGELLTGTLVEGFVVEAGQVVGVTTNDGEILANTVVVTAGAWTRTLLNTLGLDVESEPVVETRFLSRMSGEATPPEPLMIFPGGEHYVRREEHNLLVGGGGRTSDDDLLDPSNPPWCSDLPVDQAVRVLERIAELGSVVPAFAHLTIDSAVSGLPTFTPTFTPLLGRVAQFPGLVAMSGCQEAGVTHGPALGLAISECVMKGEASDLIMECHVMQ